MSKWEERFEKVVIATGLLTIMLIFTMAGIFVISTLCGQAAKAGQQPDLREGIVIDKYFSEGHDWNSTYVFGDYFVGRTHHGEDVYHIVIQSGEQMDDWRVSADEFAGINVGDYLAK
jgi:hypothetical protein